ncbi:hypothetical protein [Streptomyces resistomycificus]|uniref:Membrane protein n=1 Tax=Streptomyces resistomycificus TaxID=67356 RepID=A0A0L8LAX2_9ACTN|nr:hypothetical protein [Streptomyces resistomycificus]KOG35259.1 membrane protein [Streptomyces resistomycificus]KUN95973.1 hypothetical protein AQJ84_20875 [Streptomyces resistomycificus]
MYGNSAVPPPSRSAATVITLRVLFAAAALLSCGMFSCVPLFRVAVLRGRWFDWVVAWVSLPASIACLAVVGSLPEADRRTDVALALVLLIGAGATAYYLVTDIRVHARTRWPAGYAPLHAPTVGGGYGQTNPAGPYGPLPVPPAQSQQSLPQQPSLQHPMHQPPPGAGMPGSQTPSPAGPAVPAPPPQRPAPARIDQVRAELDELSDYLRRQDGHHDGDHEGGR